MQLSDRPILSPKLIGRASELEWLERALLAAAAGNGLCVIVGGEAGVGKTRLINEFSLQAANSGFQILRGYCFEQDTSFPYAPVADVLRTQLAGRAPSKVLDSLGPMASILLQLVPELAPQFPDLLPPPALEPEAQRRRLFEALVQFVAGLATDRPLLLILEDIHWSDDTSLDFMHFLARRLSAWPILLLASYRNEEASPRLVHLLAQLDRARLAQELVLSPLTRDQVDSMLRALFQQAFPIKPQFLDLIYTLTDGNPSSAPGPGKLMIFGRRTKP